MRREQADLIEHLVGATNLVEWTKLAYLRVKRRVETRAYACKLDLSVTTL